MRCGISTACFYPESTISSLQHVVDSGAPVTEIFLNTFHELEDGYIKKLEAIVTPSATQVVSVHPFTSAMEGFFFSSAYKGRFEDGLAVYRKYYEACQRFGARFLVFHGDHANFAGAPEDKAYAETFCRLAEAGREYGVTLCHENVFYCRLNSPERVREIRPLMGEYAAFVLDTKQAQRQGVDQLDMLAAMQGAVRHVHISDHDAKHDCIAPGTGDVDFAAFVNALQQGGYKGDMVIELYREGFGEQKDLESAMRYVQGLL